MLRAEEPRAVHLARQRGDALHPFLALGGVALGLDLDPADTVVPQLFGVGGATVGALAIAMASPEPEDVAMGAVVGSTAGLVGGALVSPLLRGDGSEKTSLRLAPRLHVPGRWGVQLVPTLLDDGQPGIYAGVTASGL